MIPRKLFSPEHELFRDSVRRFVDAELKPHHEQWESDGMVPREVWRKAGAAGMLCCNLPEEYGGSGADFLFNAIVIEELSRAGMTGPGFMQHNDMVAPYLLRYGSEDLRKKWLPRMAAGEAIGAIGITEPDAGSDVRGIRTTARRDGDDFVIRGQKVFISNGQNCDFVVLVTKSDPNRPRDAITLFLVESDRPGFRRGRNLRKIGYKAQDTSELFFDDIRVPAANMIGPEHEGFKCLGINLAHERLVQGIRSAAVAEATLEQTAAYVVQRKAFGQSIGDFQNTQFVLADLKAATMAARTFVDRCIELQMQGELAPADAAALKYVLSGLHCRVVDECLQLFGGWGYMLELPIARAYSDARVVKITGGTMEVMRQIIAREMLREAKHAI